VRADGTVIVSANAPPGGYKITAQAGDESRSRDLLVYNPRAVPIMGEWAEVAEISCGGPEVTPRRPMIAEFIFHAGGDFSETLVPFETRKDMWGNYTYDVKTEKLVLRLDYSSYLPRDTPLKGNARVDNRGRLVIRGIWLGTPSAASSDTGALKGAPKPFAGTYLRGRPPGVDSLNSAEHGICMHRPARLGAFFGLQISGHLK
jgi:hypothetical protein